MRITGPTGAFNLTGFASPTNGYNLTIYNTTAQTMTITHDATSTAGLRILTPTGADVVAKVATFIYDSTASRWVCVNYH